MRSARGALRGIGTPRLESWAEGLQEAGGDPKAHGPGNHRSPGHRSPGRSVSPARSGTRDKPLPGRASAPRGPASGPGAQAAAAPAPPPQVRLISPEPGRLSRMCAGSGDLRR